MHVTLIPEQTCNCILPQRQLKKQHHWTHNWTQKHVHALFHTADTLKQSKNASPCLLPAVLGVSGCSFVPGL